MRRKTKSMTGWAPSPFRCLARLVYRCVGATDRLEPISQERTFPLYSRGFIVATSPTPILLGTPLPPSLHLTLRSCARHTVRCRWPLTVYAATLIIPVICTVAAVGELAVSSFLSLILGPVGTLLIPNPKPSVLHLKPLDLNPKP